MKFTTHFALTPQGRDSENAYRTRETAKDRQGAHLLWQRFPRGLHLRPRWTCIM